jgi:DNA (cytosine-5)-methyltransferase 1
MTSRKVISLFTGAGGLDLGFEAAGSETAVAVEMDDQAVETLRQNRDWPVLNRDIHQVTSGEIFEVAGLREAEADILIGGPPCQPFSKAGYWASGDSLRLDDPRAGTLAAYLRVLRDTLPQSFLLENVPGLTYKGKSEGLELLERTIAGINRERGTEYRLSIAQLNAADYGVPQLRERVFVIGHREGTVFSFPDPTHQPLPDDGQQPVPGLSTYATAWDAIGDLEDDDSPDLEATGKWADLLPSIPEGENYLWHTARRDGLQLFGWRRRYWSFLLKLAKSKPSWTIQAQPGPAIGPFHWKSRRLSALEMCRLQTFPDGYEISGDLRAAQRQLGNAVPSALAEVLARQIRAELLGEQVSTAATLTPSPRGSAPDPEQPQAVPAKYHALIGDHDPHPGNGKGYGAKRWRREDQEVDSEKTQPLFAASSS